MIPVNYNLSKQKGIVLVTALVVLLILTIIGVTAMNTTTLEEKMAYNLQLDTTTFQAAESGFNLIFDEIDPTETELQTEDDKTIGDAIVSITTEFQEISPKPPLRKNAKPYSAKYKAAHFDINSVGKINNSKSTIRTGMYQILPGGS